MSYEKKLAELQKCFYGTLVERTRAEKKAGIKGKKHKANGWRHGVNHPFTLDGETFDVQPTIDLNVDLFNVIVKKLKVKFKILEEYRIVKYMNGTKARLGKDEI